MRNIVICSGPEDNLFKYHLLDLLNLLSLNFKEDNSRHADKNVNYDYIILDSDCGNDGKVDLKGSFCFVNMDHPHEGNINLYGNIITYGLGNKNTVTVSSIEDGNFGFVYCLQRYLNLNAFGMIAPQELPICMAFGASEELYAVMVAITIGLLEGIENKALISKLVKGLN